MPSDLSLFWRRLLSNPRQVSALVPSSRFLARAMTEGIGPETGPVVEFGPGTGRITRAILSRGVSPADLTLFEMDSVFARYLTQTFTGVTLHCTSAERAPELVAPGVGAVVSGLPLLSMPPDLRQRIVAAAFGVLRPGGMMVQFTYGPRPPLSDAAMAEMGLRAEAGRIIWVNHPPARVYRFFRV